MDGFLYYRVPVSSILQFATLAINSNEHHPAHHRHTSSIPPAPSPSLNRWQLHYLLHSTLSSLSPPSTPFPLPLTSLIVDFCLLPSFLSGEADGTYRLWSVDGDPLATLDTPHTDYASSVTCLPHTDTVVTGAWDGQLHLFRQQRPHSAQWTAVGRITHRHEVHALAWAFVPNPLYEPPITAQPTPTPPPTQPSHLVALLVGSSAPTLDVYDPTTLRLIHQLPGHTAKICAIAVLPPSPSPSTAPAQPAGSRVVTCSWDGDCRLWDLQRLECEAVLRGVNSALTCVACTSRGRVVAGDVKGRVWEWSITAVVRAAAAAPAVRREVDGMVGSSSSIASVTFASPTAFPHVFNFPHPAPQHPQVDIPTIAASLAITLPSPSPLRSLLPLPSSHLLLASDDGLRLYSLDSSTHSSYTFLRALADDNPDQRVYATLMLGSGRVVAGMGGKRVCLWNVEELCDGEEDAASVRLERTLSGLTKSVRCLALRECVDIDTSSTSSYVSGQGVGVGVGVSPA